MVPVLSNQRMLSGRMYGSSVLLPTRRQRRQRFVTERWGSTVADGSRCYTCQKKKGRVFMIVYASMQICAFFGLAHYARERTGNFRWHRWYLQSRVLTCKQDPAMNSVITLVCIQIDTVWCFHNFDLLLSNRVTYLIVPKVVFFSRRHRYRGSRARVLLLAQHVFR